MGNGNGQWAMGDGRWFGSSGTGLGLGERRLGNEVVLG